jgi:uncharacterized protein
MTIREDAFSGKPVSVFVIDSHTHLGPYYMSGWYASRKQTSDEAVIASLDSLGIDCIVTAPHQLIIGMMEEANRRAAAAAGKFPGRIYGYISICPGEGKDKVRKELSKYEKDQRFLGLKLLPGYHGSVHQKGYDYALDFADEKGCVVLVHTWGNCPSIYDVGSLLEKRSGMKLLCAHQGGGSADLSKDLAALMKAHPNLFMELSGSLYNTMSVEDLVVLVGEDRLIYGSDMINLDPRYDFGRVVLSTLSDDIKKKILAKNFLDILKDSEMGKIVI